MRGSRSRSEDPAQVDVSSRGPRESLRRQHWLLCVLVLFGVVAYSAFSLVRHGHFESGGYDLGLFDQAIWHYSRFEAPVSTIYLAGPANVLSDHFSPILVVLVPFYWLWDNIDVLLIAQALLLAFAAVPIWLFVRRRLGVVPAYCFAGAYLAYWGILQTVAFDFHEVAFAVPLIAFAILFADQERWRWFFGCVFVLLLVKEDLAILGRVPRHLSRAAQTSTSRCRMRPARCCGVRCDHEAAHAAFRVGGERRATRVRSALELYPAR